MSSLRLFLLGTPRVECDGMDVVLETRKATALLAILAIAGESRSREALTTLLWPESDSSRAKASLRRTIYAVNKALNPGCCNIASDMIQMTVG